MTPLDLFRKFQHIDLLHEGNIVDFPGFNIDDLILAYDFLEKYSRQNPRVYLGDVEKKLSTKSSRVIPLNDIIKHLDFTWDWEIISKSKPEIFSEDYLTKYPNLPWNFGNLSIFVPEAYLLSHLHLPWQYNTFVYRHGYNFNTPNLMDLLRVKQISPYLTEELYRNAGCDFLGMLKMEGHQWDFSVSKLILPKECDCLALIKEYPRFLENSDNLCRLYQVDPELIFTYPQYPWEKHCSIWLTNNSDISAHHTRLIEVFDTKRLNWIEMSKHADFSFIAQHSNYPWSWYYINRRDDLNLRFVYQYLSLPWDFKLFFDSEIIRKQTGYKLRTALNHWRKYVTRNQNIRSQIVKRYTKYWKTLGIINPHRRHFLDYARRTGMLDGIDS